MNNTLRKIDEVKKMIKDGKKLILAGDERALSELPAGDWIAGTIPYFMSQKGGKFDQKSIFVTEVPDYVKDFNIRVYDENNINNVYADLGDNSIGIIIIPGFSKTHLSFALNAPHFKEFAFKPLIGWISGVDLDKLGEVSPKVYTTRNGKIEKMENAAVVYEIKLPSDKTISIDTVNIFEMGEGDEIEFEETAFQAETAIINGERKKFADYIKENDLNTKLPLVADYSGERINISFQAIEDGVVKFYAPVFKNIKYKHAKPVENYVKQFEKEMPPVDKEITFSCNCILNYLYSELEGKKTGKIRGPITFGEIAYQLLNQTLVYFSIQDA